MVLNGIKMKRSIELDGLRGLAILLVLLFHYFYYQWDTPGGWAAYLRQTLALNWAGVDLFFVLSGFLIVGILLENRKSEGFYSVFYLRRAFRILPLYLVLLGSFSLLSLSQFGLDSSWTELNFPEWSYYTFTQNLFMAEVDPGPKWLAPTWSLAIEEQFYLGIPFLVAYVRNRSLLLIFIGLILLAPILRGVHGNGSLAAYYFPWCRADALSMGGLLALAVKTPCFLNWLQGNSTRICSIFWLLSGCIPILGFFHRELGGVMNHTFFAIWFGLLLLVSFFQWDSRINSICRSPLLIWLGLRSYGIYLIHQPVSGFLHAVVRQASPVIDSAASLSITLLALAGTLVLAEVSFRLLEGPCIRFSHRFRYGESGSASPLRT